MSLREEQCQKVCRILDDVLANRPTERDSLIVATRSAFSALSEPHWISMTENTPKEYHRVCLVTMNGCLEPYTDKSTWVDGKWYQIEYTTDGYPRKIDITDAVLAWMPLPEPYKGVTE